MANTSPAAKFTSIAQKLSIKDDIKFLHIKKTWIKIYKNICINGIILWYIKLSKR